ncbi:ureidoglycolate lyase [Devosia enhydra]|uniref:Ureidoglycolate lyase n=1 Tax=Devosia enhydra TaxID=665118 RepID=A0A1K2HW87_9HYPH|nr:ureidoglycolate lyase [Devosia enhydra]SFZ83192.1 ureidoglycolate lyase [Devosia enhydra]
MSGPFATIIVEPLTREAFAPFGQVITTEGAASYPINEGMTDRYNDLAPVELGGETPRPLISIFRGRPYALPLTLKLVERHPLGSQAFMPLAQRPFLVTVAPDEDGRPGQPRSFLVPLSTGINIGRNVWHGVLTPLEAESDFLVVDRGGPGNNLELFHFPDPPLIVSA